MRLVKKAIRECWLRCRIPYPSGAMHSSSPAANTLDLVIISGDLTEDGEIDDYRYLKTWLENALGETTILVTLGNHDIKEHFG